MVMGGCSFFSHGSNQSGISRSTYSAVVQQPCRHAWREWADSKTIPATSLRRYPDAEYSAIGRFVVMDWDDIDHESTDQRIGRRLGVDWHDVYDVATDSGNNRHMDVGRNYCNNLAIDQ